MSLHEPIALENASGTDRPNAQELRVLIQHLLGPTAQEGVVGTGSYAVSEKGTPDMSVDIASGFAFIEGTEAGAGSPDAGLYSVFNDATVNVAISAADATNPRKDVVILYIRDSQGSGANDDAQLAVVTGTPAASPSKPDPSAAGYDNYIELATVDVPATDTSIENAQITDERTCTGGGIVVCTSSTRPASPYEGQLIYETDNDALRVYDGSNWIDWTPTEIVYERVSADNVSLNATDKTIASVSVAIPSYWNTYDVELVANWNHQDTGASSNRTTTQRLKWNGSTIGGNTTHVTTTPGQVDHTCVAFSEGESATGSITALFSLQLGTNDSYEADNVVLLARAIRTS